VGEKEATGLESGLDGRIREGARRDVPFGADTPRGFGPAVMRRQGERGARNDGLPDPPKQNRGPAGAV